MIKLVLADMDNTLIPAGAENVSYRTINAIRTLQESGVRFAPATGRDTYELDRMFFGARDCYATAIAQNGKKVLVDGELRHQQLVDREPALRLAELLRNVPNAFLVADVADNPRGKLPRYCVGAREGDAQWFGEYVNFMPGVCDEVPDADLIALMIACSGSDGQLHEIMARAHELVPEFDYALTLSHWCDVMPHGVSKGASLRILLDELGISAGEVAFFGDGENDLAMMELVGHPVAVANAVPAVAEAARWHVGACEDDGVAAALEELALAQEVGEVPAFMRG